MDQGVPPLNSSTLHVNITLVDENDNNPKFDQVMYSVEVWENETIGGHVVQVKATERDSAVGSQIGYNISAGDPHGQFKIFYNSVSSSFVIVLHFRLYIRRVCRVMFCSLASQTPMKTPYMPCLTSCHSGPRKYD